MHRSEVQTRMARIYEISGLENTLGGPEVFEPHPLLRNPHLATVTAAYLPRTASSLPVAERFFEVEAETRLLAKCHWQQNPQQHPTLVLIHGFEGSSESPYVLGTAGRVIAPEWKTTLQVKV